MLIGLIGGGGFGSLVRFFFLHITINTGGTDMQTCWHGNRGAAAPPSPKLPPPPAPPEGWQRWGGPAPPPGGRLRAVLGVRAWCCCPKMQPDLAVGLGPGPIAMETKPDLAVGLRPGPIATETQPSLAIQSTGPGLLQLLWKQSLRPNHVATGRWLFCLVLFPWKSPQKSRASRHRNAAWPRSSAAAWSGCHGNAAWPRSGAKPPCPHGVTVPPWWGDRGDTSAAAIPSGLSSAIRVPSGSGYCL